MIDLHYRRNNKTIYPFIMLRNFANNSRAKIARAIYKFPVPTEVLQNKGGAYIKDSSDVWTKIAE